MNLHISDDYCQQSSKCSVKALVIMRRCCTRGGAIREAEVGRKREEAAAQYYSGEISFISTISEFEGQLLLCIKHWRRFYSKGATETETR